MKMHTIIFCHYGNSDYLYFVLNQARLSNPDGRVVLLGDETNVRTAEKAGVEHVFFSDCAGSLESQQFNSVYQHVAGRDHGKEFWTKFVFQRWFYVLEFAKAENLTHFWHFDSDNMILADLSEQEHKFSGYDNTEQCNGLCMNGFISSLHVVEGYLQKIIRLFEDEDYLAKQRQEFQTHPDMAFTEMRAYRSHKRDINTIRLNQIINHESFDDCICEHHGYERYETLLNGRLLKKIYLDTNGVFYCFHTESNDYIKMNSLNFSWVPNYLFEIISTVYQDQRAIPKHASQLENGYYLLDVHSAPRANRFERVLKKILP